MIGRKVNTGYSGQNKIGEVIKWEPLGAGMCDALVRHTDGSECWYGSSSLKPIDGLGPLPSRQEAREKADVRALDSLKAIRMQHVRDGWAKPWPGFEFGKAHFGNMVNGAISEVEERIKARGKKE